MNILSLNQISKLTQSNFQKIATDNPDIADELQDLVLKNQPTKHTEHLTTILGDSDAITDFKKVMLEYSFDSFL